MWSDDRYATLVKERDEILKAGWRAHRAVVMGTPGDTEIPLGRLNRLEAALWYLARWSNRKAAA